MTEEKAKLIENSLNELIEEAVKGGGHVFIVDRMQNEFFQRLTKPIKLSYYGGYKGESHEE